MADQVDGPVKTFIAGGTITQYDVVKLNSSGTVERTGGVASEDSHVVGIAQAAAASGAEVPVRHINCVASSKCRAGSAITKGSRVYAITGGEVDDVSTSLTAIGVALEAASAADEVIEVAHVQGRQDDMT